MFLYIKDIKAPLLSSVLPKTATALYYRVENMRFNPDAYAVEKMINYYNFK